MPPLTTRDALTAALAEALHGLRFGAVPPEGVDPYAREDAAHLADALLASGALTDATKLAEEVARIRQWLWKASQGDHTRIREAGIMQEACAQLDAALSAQSERAEVER